jgi:DNA polymerase zeta
MAELADAIGKLTRGRAVVIYNFSNFSVSLSLSLSPPLPPSPSVQCGRSTLEWVITEVEAHTSWRGKVVYGDTDSVFVHLKGRTKAEAFKIGAEIAHEITRKSPVDVLLKMEKVYLPSVLVSKKRYVGNMFEDCAPNSKEVGHFDAKGIEVVRRDQCGATVKIQEKALRILFETKDLSLVKEYLYKQVSE